MHVNNIHINSIWKILFIQSTAKNHEVDTKSRRILNTFYERLLESEGGCILSRHYMQSFNRIPDLSMKFEFWDLLAKFAPFRDLNEIPVFTAIILMNNLQKFAYFKKILWRNSFFYGHSTKNTFLDLSKITYISRCFDGDGVYFAILW